MKGSLILVIVFITLFSSVFAAQKVGNQIIISNGELNSNTSKVSPQTGTVVLVKFYLNGSFITNASGVLNNGSITINTGDIPSGLLDFTVGRTATIYTTNDNTSNFTAVICISYTVAA